MAMAASLITFGDDFEKILEKGKVNNGLRDSIWETIETDSSVLLNVYKHGLLLTSQHSKVPGGNFFFYDLSLPHPSKIFVPEFSAGLNALGTFISHHIQYPAEARKNHTQETVVLSFVVEENGKLTDAKVIKGIGDGCEEESVRLIKLPPSWKPATQNGKPVTAAFCIRMAFTLSN